MWRSLDGVTVPEMVSTVSQPATTAIKSTLTESKYYKDTVALLLEADRRGNRASLIQKTLARLYNLDNMFLEACFVPLESYLALPTLFLRRTMILLRSSPRLVLVRKAAATHDRAPQIVSNY